MLESVIKKISSLLKFGRTTIYDFNLVGLDDHARKDQVNLEAMEEIKRVFRDFNESLKKEIDALYSEANQNRRKQRKFLIANQITEKIKELYEMGKTNKIYKTDYKVLKQELLSTQFGLFGSSADAEVFESTVRALEDNGIVPHGSRKAIAKLSPMGRWL